MSSSIPANLRIHAATSPRNVIKVLVAIWLGLLTYNALMQVSGLLTIRDYETNFWSNIPYMTLKIWLPWVIASPIIVHLTRRYPIRPETWLKGIALHLVFFLALSLAIGLTLALHYHYRETMTPMMETYQPWQHVGHYLFGDRLLLFHIIIYTVFLAAFNIQNIWAIALQRERDSAHMASQLKDAQLRALKMQINPHFLFNTLNGLSVLVAKGETKSANQMIRRLSAFFRSTLEETDEQWIPLARELEMTSQYLAIEQVRFADRLTVEEAFDPAAMGIEVPAMILQPLVENAMQHGIAETDGACTLRIASQANATRLRLTISDDGAGCVDTEIAEGIGLRNVRERLRQSYGDDFALNLSGAPDRGVTVEIDVPIAPRGAAP